MTDDPVGARLRIAIDARSLLCAHPRGEGKSLLRLYQEISALRPDWEFLFFGDERGAAYRGTLPRGGRAVLVPSLTHRMDLWEDLMFPLRARLAGCRVMHCASSSAPRMVSMPMLLTVHDLIPIVFDDGHDENARSRFARRLGFGMLRADATVCVSENTRSDLLRHFPRCTTPVSVAHWGCESSTDAARQALDPPTVLIFGGEARRKNTAYSVERFIAAARRVPAMRLELIGITNPAQREGLQSRLAEAGLADRVNVPGFISEADLANTLRRASALLYLSLYEGFGLPILEAISQGIPVLASDRTSLPEILRDTPGAYSLEEPGAIEDALVRISTDPDAHAAMIQSQRSIVQRFRWKDTAEHYIERLEHLCRH